MLKEMLHVILRIRKASQHFLLYVGCLKAVSGDASIDVLDSMALQVSEMLDVVGDA